MALGFTSMHIGCTRPRPAATHRRRRAARRTASQDGNDRRARQAARSAPISSYMTISAKICGLSSEEGVAAAIEGGAAYLGFVFYPPSPRAVIPARARELCAAVPDGVLRVGLFVDADDTALAAALDAVALDILQFHGQESPSRVAEAKARFGRPVMKVISVAAEKDVEAAAGYEEVADLLLFDAKPPRRADALPGG